MNQLRFQKCGATLGCKSLILAVLLAAWVIPARGAEAQEKKSQAESKTSAQTKTVKVDVNSADSETLQTLPGVGPAIARNIIEGRPYRKLEDLEQVKGLGKAKVDALKTQVRFGPSGTANNAKASTTEPKTVREKPATTSANTGTHRAGESKPVREEPPTTRPLTPTGDTSGRLSPGEKININKATTEDLDRLPGIGPVKSQAIIDYRNQHGGFKTIEEIQQVKGIKEGEFSKLKDFIKVR